MKADFKRSTLFEGGLVRIYQPFCAYLSIERCQLVQKSDWIAAQIRMQPGPDLDGAVRQEAAPAQSRTDRPECTSWSAPHCRSQSGYVPPGVCSDEAAGL